MIKCRPIIVIAAPNHFDKMPFCLTLTKPMTAKITDNDKSIAALKKPRGLRASNSIGIPPIKDMSNQRAMWFTHMAAEYVRKVRAIHFFTSDPKRVCVLFLIFLRRINRNGIVKKV